MPIYVYRCDKCKGWAEIGLSIKEDIPRALQCECGGVLGRVYTPPGLVFKGEDWPSQDVKRKDEDDRIFTRARIARRMKASGKVPMEETIKAKDVDPSKFHGDLSYKELKEKRCDYQGLKAPKKKKEKDA